MAQGPPAGAVAAGNAVFASNTAAGTAVGPSTGATGQLLSASALPGRFAVVTRATVMMHSPVVEFGIQEMW